MASCESGTLIDLNDREAISLDDVRGATLRLLRGTLWVTQEHDPDDVVLRPGDNWVVERDGRTVVEAQEKSSLCVVGRKVSLPHVEEARWVEWRQRLSQFLVRDRAFIPYV